jgi:putative flippase GtrA
MPTGLRRFARFATVGALASAVHTAVFALAIELGHVEAVLANAIAFSVAVLVGYALNRRWTFAAHGAAHARLWRYVIAQLIGLAWNSVIMFAAVHGAKWSPYLGLLLSLLLVPPLTFALNQLWVFRRRG